MMNKTFEYSNGKYFFKKYFIYSDRERVDIITDQRSFDRTFDTVTDFLLLFKEVTPSLASVAKQEKPLHDESEVKIFKTLDYKRFNKIKGNRNLNQRKIDRIISDIESGVDLLKYYPIQVNKIAEGLLDIADGQHRFNICKRLKKPVYYIIVEKDLELSEIAKVNSNVEKWHGKDFINCYSELGNDNYKQLNDLLKNYPAPLTTAICMLQYGRVNSGGGNKNDFERGEFKINHWDYTKKILEYASLFEFGGKYSRSFIKTLCIIDEGKKISMDDIINKVKEDPSALTVHDHHKDYLTNLETIMNYKKSIRVVIY